jgi:hypothetical protein
MTLDIKLCKKKISTICLKKQYTRHDTIFQIWYNLCSELTSMWTFKMYSRNTKTTNEPTASNNKSDRPQVKIWDTLKTLKYLNINDFFFTWKTLKYLNLYNKTPSKAIVNAAFTWVLMLKMKPVISNTGRFFCFNSTVSYTYPWFENYDNFWLVKTPGIKKNIFPGVARPYYRV